MICPEINWTRLRSPDDCVPLRGFAADTPDTNPDRFARLGSVPFGERVTDADGHRFRVLGHGSVQGSVVVQDRYRRQFQADIGTTIERTPA